MSKLCDEIENLGKGFGNASRYQIIQTMTKGEKTVSQIVDAVNLSQSAVSQHLKVLKSAKLVISERRGQEVYYSVNRKHTMELLKDLLTEINKCPSNK